MTKPCRDSKGKFVSRGERIEVLKSMIAANTAIFTAVLPSSPSCRWHTYEKRNVVGSNGIVSGHAQACYIRQFRNQYKIYECF